jgi:hypothetical protein
MSDDEDDVKKEQDDRVKPIMRCGVVITLGQAAKEFELAEKQRTKKKKKS